MDQPVAIIGMACRFPGEITDPEKLWKTVAEGRSCWTKVPKDRFNEEAFLHPDPDFRGGHNHRGGHFLSQNVAAFDAKFFGFSRAEVSSMDPQQRILLETSYEAFESGGLPIHSVRGSDAAVYVAAFTHDYDRILSKDLDDVPKYYTTGTGEAIMSNRISYFFDLHGPSITLDTGCSGSLVALHQGCQSLRIGESSMALVAGVNLMLTPDCMIGMSNFNMLNDEGKSFAFDDRGSGYGRGEGCAAVVLKRLDDALRCNDPIRAVIRGSGVNQDGKTSGITKPNSVVQTRLAEAVLRNCGVLARDIKYVEAHGTGTAAGDIAEMQSIIRAYGSDRTDLLYVGSIKSNVGHLESASGLAGLLKAVLVLEKGCVPPQVCMSHLKPDLRLNKSNVKIPRELVVWQHHQKRMVSVNSFGYGGTNAHVILEQAPEARCGNEEIQGRPQLFTFSANSEKSLKQYLIKVGEWLTSHERHNVLKDLAFTFSTRRTTYDWRSSFVATSSTNLSEELVRTIRDEMIHKASSKPKVIFLFTGQAAQWAGMARELIVQGSPFTSSLHRSSRVLQRLGASWDLVQELQVEEQKSRLDHSEFAQPICTALQISLVDLFAVLGVQPSAVIGHSSGEIGAAYAAGVLSQESALKVAYHRGFVSAVCRRLVSSKGGMLAVGLGADEAKGLISQISRGRILVACVNSHLSTTISGDEEGGDELKSLLDTRSVFTSEPYKEALKDLTVGSLGPVQFISTVTGTSKFSEFGKEYWVANLVSTVQYRQAIQKFMRMQIENTAVPNTSPLFVEIGPHTVLASLTQDIVRNDYPQLECKYVPTLVKDSDSIHTFLNSVGRLFEAGLQIDLGSVLSLTETDGPMRCIPDLPPYAWDHSETYWHESRLSKEYRFAVNPYHDLLGVRISSSTPIEPRWRNLISVEKQPWLKDHRVNDQVIFPGAAYMCMAIEAVRQMSEEAQKSEGLCTYLLKDVSFSKALILQETPKNTEIQLSLSPPLKAQDSLEKSWLNFRITAMDSKNHWADHCSGQVGIVLDDQADAISGTNETRMIFETQSRSSSRPYQEYEKAITAGEFYHELRESGNAYGLTFAAVKELRMYAPNRATALVPIPHVSKIMPHSFMQSFIIHPATLDALMHSSLPLFQAQNGKGFMMPLSVGELRISSRTETKPGTQLVVNTSMRPEGSKEGIVQLLASKSIKSSPQEAIIQISNMRLRGFTYTKRDSMEDKLPIWTVIWEPAPDKYEIAGPKTHHYGSQCRIELLQNTDFEGSCEDISQQLLSGLQRWGNIVAQTSWNGLLPDKNSIYVVLDDGKRPMLANLTEQSLKSLVTLVTVEISILWISISDDPTADTNAEKSLINGFARTAHAENDRLKLCTLDIQQPWVTCCDVVIDTVAGLLGRDFTIFDGDTRKEDREFIFRDGQVLRPRIVPAPGPTDWVLARGNGPNADHGIGIGLENSETSLKFLDGNATYVVAGGLGFIGRKLCHLMARRGARHLVVLSRRRLDSTDSESEASKLRDISSAVRLYCLECDISVLKDVEKAKSSLAAMGLPPVKGVVQSATVLNDQLLASMKVQTFNDTLSTKLYGTRNLSRVFESNFLEFFVSLSSLTATVGTRGQANYTAGNAFQDAFAYSHRSPNAHYTSISPGMIHNSDVNDEIRERNLRLHGLVPVGIDELMSLLEYSMCPQSKQDNCKQALVGFTEESLAHVDIPNANVHSAMFSRVFDTTTNIQPESKNGVSKSLKHRMNRTNGPNQIKTLIVAALAQKLGELISAHDIDAMMHKPFVELGLDSLSTLELSNWTSYNFDISFKPFELMGMDSALALAESVYDRYEIAKETIGSESNKATKYDRTAPEILHAPIAQARPNTSPRDRLPDLPLPDLENTLRMYQESLHSFRTSEELEVTKKAIQEFLHDGTKLQARLQARAEDPIIGSWQNDLYSSNIYLRRRDPIHPFTTFFGGHILTENFISQIKKAAIITEVAFNFKHQMSSGNLVSDEIHGDALCTESWAWLFNACREPDVHVDKMRKYPGNDYAVVLRRGHIFKVSWRGQRGTGWLSVLESAFKRVIELSQVWQLSAASLTADDRASWASIRQSLLAECATNRDTLRTVEAATLVICLDDGSPKTPSERCNQFFLGNPDNRWSDKNLQFVICDNGVSAVIGEHSMLDGLSVRKLQQAITAAIVDNDNSTSAGSLRAVDTNLASDETEVQELAIMLNSASKDRIGHVRHRFRHDFAPIEFSHHEVGTFGTELLRQYGCSPKSGYQLVIQLACLLYYGYQPPSWETISMARFHQGRVDWIQTVTPLVVQFCSSAIGDSIPRTKCRKLFFDAAIAHTNQMNTIARGHGFKAHLHALREVIRDDEPIPKLFQEPAWEMTRVQSTKIVKTDCSEGMMLQETAFLMPKEDCIFLHFDVKEDKCLFFVQAWEGRTRAICERLEQAARIIKLLVEAG